jgi:hypothetical protein
MSDSKKARLKNTKRTKKKAKTNVNHTVNYSILLGHNSVDRWALISFLFVRVVRFVFNFLACYSASTHGAIRFVLFCYRALCPVGPRVRTSGKEPYVSAYGS